MLDTFERSRSFDGSVAGMDKCENFCILAVVEILPWNGPFGVVTFGYLPHFCIWVWRFLFPDMQDFLIPIARVKIYLICYLYVMTPLGKYSGGLE